MSAEKESVPPDTNDLLRRILSAVEPAKPKPRFEIACAIVLALATTASAWCAYQSKLWGGEQAAFPYDNLVDTNHERSRQEFEYELINIGVFDRSSPLPTGGYLEQADGTAWMALFSLNMLEIAAELAQHNETYKGMALKFMQHFAAIASATIHAGGNTGMWDEEGGFFYDVLQLPSGQAQGLKVRSMVGLLPLCAVTVFEGFFAEKYPDVMERLRGFLGARLELRTFIHDPAKVGQSGPRLGAILDETKLRRVPTKMLDESEFLSPYGIRALSRRLGSIFLKGKDGNCPVNGGEKKLQEDPHWRDYVQFYEYFHGDNGAGLGANHQTGWTGVIARLMHLFATTTSDQVLELGKLAAVVEIEKPASSSKPATSASRKR